MAQLFTLRNWGAQVANSRHGRAGAFTIIELIVVISIILVLAGLVLATSSYVHNKGARSRAEAEIAAFSAALENYKADNGVYPSNGDTAALDARHDFNPSETPLPNKYTKGSLWVYKQLSGDLNGDRAVEASSYFSFKDNQLSPATGTVAYIKDPFGNSYGYSTAGQAGTSGIGYNPTFDLWSTAGQTTSPGQSQWVKNW